MISYRKLLIDSLTSDEIMKLDTLLKLDAHNFSFYIPSSLGHYILWVAENEGEMIGLILALHYPISHEVQFPLFLVKTPLFDEAASQLLKRMIEELSTTSAKFLEIVFDARKENAEKLKHLLENSGWTRPTPLILEYYFQPATFTAPWMNNDSFEPKKPYYLENWVQLSMADHEVIKKTTPSITNVSFLSPFDPVYSIEPSYSFALKKEREIRGWLAVHRINPSLIRYSSLYIHPQDRALGAALWLLKISIKTFISSEPSSLAFMEINQKYSSTAWIHFVQHQLAPYSISTNTIYSSFLKLR